MTASFHKLIVTASTAAALLITTAAMAKATGGRPGQNNSGHTGGPGATTSTNSNPLKNLAHERALKKEQLLKDRNTGNGINITQGGGNLPKEPGNNPSSGSGFTITQGGGNLPKEPGNNPDKGCDHNWDHGCHEHDCYDYHCSWRSYGFYDTCVEPMNRYVVLPGDTFESISLKVFGNPSASADIAMFNRIPTDAALAPGQVLMLPPIGGTL